jgi:hypothetical protein
LLKAIPARPGVTSAYAIAYVVTLISFTIVWFKYPYLLYLSRDADLSLWLSKAYLAWARPLDVTAMNPLQGMTSMLMAMNPWFNPAAWVLQTDLPELLKLIFSFIVYFFEVTASTFALAVALGFSRKFSFVASLWLAFLLFPPFNFVYGLAGWLGTTPLYGHTLALSSLLLIALLRIGATSTGSSFARRLAVNWLLATAIFLLVLLIVLAAPFYNGGMLIGSFLLAGVIVLSSTSLEQLFWRLAAGSYVLACCAALHFVTFFMGARAASVRFSEPGRSLLDFRWPVHFSSDLVAQARTSLCEWGVVCDRLTNWPGAWTGSHWLQLSIVLGGIAVAIRMPAPLARIGALFSALWVTLLMLWIGASLGIVGMLPFSPLYFYLMMYPFWAFFSLYAGVTLIETIAIRLAPRAQPPDHRWISAALCAAALALIPIFHAGLHHILDWRNPRPHIATPITETLQQEISLRPGQTYRGSVATLLGSPGSPLKRRLLGSAEQPLKPFDFEQFIQALAIETGNNHDLLDLWWFDIPTLSEYGQGLSKPFMFYISNVLNALADAKEPNFGFPRLAKIDVLRAMGVRFIITDLDLPANKASLKRALPLNDGTELRLYELPNPNVAGFSPLKLSAQISPSELLQRITADPTFFEAEAFVDSGIPQELVAVQQSRVVYERGAVHVTASSPASSALLLPVQFSHCFRLIGERTDGVRVLRANLIHTLVLFSGELDVRLKWEFSFWRNSGCRMRDAEDARALGLP